MATSPPSIKKIPRTIARWIGVQRSLSAMTWATPTGSSSGVTGCTRLPTPPRMAPTIAAHPPILNTQRVSTATSGMAVPPLGLLLDQASTVALARSSALHLRAGRALQPEGEAARRLWTYSRDMIGDADQGWFGAGKLRRLVPLFALAVAVVAWATEPSATSDLALVAIPVAPFFRG